MDKKTLLVAINTKYIHSNPAIYSLKANAGKYADAITLCEYTINHRREEILGALYEQKADIIAFSCYLWNIEYVREIARELKKLSPNVILIAGGPEVSYHPEDFLLENPDFHMVMTGEGEKTFAKYMTHVMEGGDLSEIKGLVYRKGNHIHRTESQEPVDMEALIFPYGGLEGLKNRIVYYESMRGCPFSCSYCLSSIDKSVRKKSLEKTMREIDIFLEEKVPQVKFTDRTFNCDHAHAYGIWKYLKEHDNGITNFHFEIAGDLLREEDFLIFSDMRPGLIQFEIGVQSVNPDTIRAIRRVMDLARLKENIKRLQKAHNIHVHLDLIAGLPYEDFESFRHSFYEVYDMNPDQLQLGFLKVLDGSYMNEKTEGYGVVYSTWPPYEVYATKWISYEEIRKLKQTEEMVEVYYNSMQFKATISYLNHFFENPFDLFCELGEYYTQNGLADVKHNRISRYTILERYAETIFGIETEILRDTLTYDLYSREFVKNPPAFVEKKTEEEKEKIRRLFLRLKEDGALPDEYREYSLKQLMHGMYVHTFRTDIRQLLETGSPSGGGRYTLMFDYKNRSPLDHSAGVLPVGIG